MNKIEEPCTDAEVSAQNPASPAVELTVVETRLQTTIQQANLEPATAQGLMDTFKPLFAKAHEICATAANLVVTDATQVTEIKQARALRLALRSVRIEADKTRKSMKEDSLRRGKAIDGVYNVLEFAVAPVESRLLEMEEFAERAEASRKAAAKASREELLKPYAIDTTFYQLGEMSEQAFAQLLDNTRTAHEAKLATARRAEEERIAREKAEAAERERIRLENERLKREAEEKEAARRAEEERKIALGQSRQSQIRTKYERSPLLGAAVYGEMTDDDFQSHVRAIETQIAKEKAEAAERERLAKERAEIEEKARIERKAAAAKIAEERRIAEENAAAERRRVEAEQKAAAEKARIEAERVAKEKAELERKAREEREARERIESAERARREADEKRAKDEAAAAAKAAAAPDRDKLQAFAAQIRALKVPTMATNAGMVASANVALLVDELANQVDFIAAGLGQKEAA